MGKTYHECTDKMLYCRNEEVKRVIVEIYLVLWSRFEIVIICHKRIYNNWTTSLHLQLRRIMERNLENMIFASTNDNRSQSMHHYIQNPSMLQYGTQKNNFM